MVGMKPVKVDVETNGIKLPFFMSRTRAKLAFVLLGLAFVSGVCAALSSLVFFDKGGELAAEILKEVMMFFTYTGGIAIGFYFNSREKQDTNR